MGGQLVRREQIASHPSTHGRSVSPPDGAVLRLQRAIGNRATRALLRAPPKPGEFALVEDLYPTGTMDAAAWKDKVTAAKEALEARRYDEARALYTLLYQ